MAIIKPFRIKSFKNTNSIISFENVSISFGNRTVLDNVNFKINEKTIHGLLGPNGAGKSTMYHLITGLLEPRQGKILINGENVTKLPVYLRTKQYGISFVPLYGGHLQILHFMTIWKLSVMMRIKTWIRKSKLLNIKTWIDNIKTLDKKFVWRWKKKTCCFIFVGKPKILLLDEPFSALDVLTIKMLQELIIIYAKQYNICICDHIASSLLQISDTAMILSNGKIVAQNSPSNLVKDRVAQSAYFGNNFKFN